MLRIISLVILGIVGAAECQDCEDVQMLQAERPLKLLQQEAMKAECGPPVAWPCTNSKIASFPLQVINSEDCKNDPFSTIFRLDLSPGTAGGYTPLCHIQDYCLNACGIDPDTNQIFCSQRPEGSENLVRVDCNIADEVPDILARLTSGTLNQFQPVSGTVCFFGKLQPTFAANFDIDGNFWFKRSIFSPANEGEIYRITDATFDNLGAGATSSSATFVTGGQFELLKRNDLGLVDDLNVITLELQQGDPQEYVTGCFGNKVALQRVTGSNLNTANPIILEMVGENPGQGDSSSGAQWLFDGHIFCAYNDGTSGVIEILLDTIDLMGNKVNAVRVSDSDPTNSNDGLSCLKAPPPFEGGEAGDPHIQTFDGEHYLLLNQGSFSFWNFSGVDAQVSQTKRVPVNFQIFTHYSGHSSYTKGLLLVDLTGQGDHPGHALEVTAEDCRWRTRSDVTWRLVEGRELLTVRDAEGDAITAFNMTTSSGHMHAELLMKTMQGFRKIGNVYAMCKPHHHINVKVSMFSKKDLLLVQGQLGHHAESNPHGLQPAGLLQGQKLSLDEDLKTTKTWEELGGSLTASTYLKQVDEEGAAFLKECTAAEKDEARATCAKFLGSHPDPKEIGKDRAQLLTNIFEDCVFDVCASGDPAAAELAAAYMNGF